MIGRVQGLSVDIIPEKDLKMVEDKLNNTPRKCLGFLTPYEVRERILKFSSTH